MGTQCRNGITTILIFASYVCVHCMTQYVLLCCSTMFGDPGFYIINLSLKCSQLLVQHAGRVLADMSNALRNSVICLMLDVITSMNSLLFQSCCT